MKDFLLWLIKAIVDKPEEVSLEEEKLEEFSLLKLSVAKDDMGKVIGKEGRIIKSIRQLLKVRGIKEGRRVSLELLE